MNAINQAANTPAPFPKLSLAIPAIGNMVSEMTNSLHSLILKIRASETVFIAAINGAAAGGGLGLALSADYRICSEQAKRPAAFFGLGASADGGTTWLLPRRVGSQRAKKFFFNNSSSLTSYRRCLFLAGCMTFLLPV